MRRPVLSWRENFRILSLAASAGGRVYSGGDPSGGIGVWDSRTGRKEYVIEGHQGPVLALATLSNMDVLLTGGSDGTVRLFSLRTLQNVLVMEGTSRLVSCVACGTDGVGLALFSGGEDGTVQQWCAVTGACLHSYVGHVGPVNALCCLQEVKLMASGGEDGWLRIWSVATHKNIGSVVAHLSPVWSIAALDADRVVTGGAEAITMGAIKIWAVSLHRPPHLVMSIHGVGGLQSVSRLLTYRHFLFTAGGKGELNLWNTITGEVESTLMFHSRRITGLTLENNKLCVSSLDHTFSRWNVQDLLGQYAQPLMAYPPLLIGIGAPTTGMEETLEGKTSRRRNRHTTGSRLTSLGKLQGKENDAEYIHSVEGHSTAERTGNFLSITPTEAAMLHQELPLSFILFQLNHYSLNMRWWFDLIVFAVLLICFTLLHGVYGTTQTRMFVSEGVQSQLTHFPLLGFRQGRTFPSVINTALFYNWLELAVVDLWTNRVSTLDPPALSGYNVLLGTLNVQVQRVEGDSCQWDPIFVQDIPHKPTCYADARQMRKFNLRSKKPYLCPRSSACPSSFVPDEDDSDPSDSDSFAREERKSWKEACDALPLGADCTTGFQYKDEAGIEGINAFGQGGHMVDFIFTDNATAQRYAVRALKTLGFVDDLSTRYVAVHLYTYNPNSDIFLALHYTLENEAAGSWKPVVYDKGFELYNWETMRVRLALNCVVLIIAALLILMIGADFVMAIRTRSVFTFLVRFWFLFDLAWCSLAIASVAYFFQWIKVSGKINLQEMISLSSPDSRDALLSQSVPIRHQLHELCNKYDQYNRIASVVAACVYGKALFFLLQTEFCRSFRSALSYLRYLVLIPLFIFCVSALFCAHSLTLVNGTSMGDFRSFSLSYLSLMNLFIGGFSTTNFEAMYHQQEVQTAIVMVLLFLYFQLILAGLFTSTIIESYKVVSGSTPSVPLVVSLFNFFSQTRHRVLQVGYRIKDWATGHHRSPFSDTIPNSDNLSHADIRRIKALMVRRLRRKLGKWLEEGDLSSSGGGDGNISDVEGTSDGSGWRGTNSREGTYSAGTSTSRDKNMDGVRHQLNLRPLSMTIAHNNINHSVGTHRSDTTDTTTRSRSTNPLPRSVMDSTRSSTTASSQRSVEATLLKQADLISLLFSTEEEDEEEKTVDTVEPTTPLLPKQETPKKKKSTEEDQDDKAWALLIEEDADGHGGIGALTREVITTLWEHMAYQYHVHMTYKDTAKETAVAAELERVREALGSMTSVFKLVNDVQKSLDENEGTIRPLVEALEAGLASRKVVRESNNNNTLNNK
ncbi:hypothetical protein AGDE_14048 [Angomonas deanei]|uniref:WD domain, G-beta repeat/Polycystin cation channel, putative n=1 Tax=Angomonas deanei TaxID=59799 RepID=A0A7G2CT15_9TRYP|nr:hypothetical protein AGDE_14048 [Angomonas deanei]CAD2222930.1 WD domain, G-beta repeat/Polycystin cation channel, putative [Angomonas deanei]|eukprot:EPY21519.1 hypothetical protein AGDE_14048 [Angomonas deanei]